MAQNEQILRAQLKQELKNRRQCAHQSYNCSNLNVDGSRFCLRHILQDKNAPFKQCSYFYQSNGKRCYLAAVKSDKKDNGYCSEHAIKASLQRYKQNSANPPPVSAESLLSNLTVYIKQPKNSNASVSKYEGADTNFDEEEGRNRIVQPPDPFAFDVPTIFNNRCNEVLDMCSDSETDVEPSTNATVWHDAQADSSDNESIDSEQGDPLKHANVYTADEITSKLTDKLVKLQSLYTDQFVYMLNWLKEEKRKYNYNLKREKETCCNIYSQVRENPKEQRLYKKLKHYANYNKSSGEDALEIKRALDRRIRRLHGVKSNIPKCIFSEGGVRCVQKPLPQAKYCRKHVTEDVTVALYIVCGKLNFDVKCNIAIEGLSEDSTCNLHKVFPPIRSYSQSRKDSESDPEDTLDLPPHYAMPTNDNIKTEIIDYSLPSLSKMETLPSLLFEDSAESLSSTLQYSTSEFTEGFVEQNSSDVQESSNTANLNVIDNELEITNSEVVDESKTNDSIEFKIQNFHDGPEIEQNQEEINIVEETLVNKEHSESMELEHKREESNIVEENVLKKDHSDTTECISETAENISVVEGETETENIDLSHKASSSSVECAEEVNKSGEKMEVD